MSGLGRSVANQRVLKTTIEHTLNSTSTPWVCVKKSFVDCHRIYIDFDFDTVDLCQSFHTFTVVS